MKVLVVGGGGREHALAWALSKSSSIKEVLATPGNPGIASVAECLESRDVIGTARKIQADLVVIGPEQPLADGLGDRLRSAGFLTFGPDAKGARLESSKSWAKDLMRKQGIPTAAAKVFDDAPGAKDYVRSVAGAMVVKAEGLAAGKGVVVCESAERAIDAIDEAMIMGKFGDSGRRVLIEERMEGPELSFTVLFDGKCIVPLQAARDYKRLEDGDKGPNTGGMGAVSSPSLADDVYDEIVDKIMQPLAAGLQDQPNPYRGAIFAGLMLTSDGVKVVEFNCRFGDPEAQVVLPCLTSDLGEALASCASGDLSSLPDLEWSGQSAVCVVAASGGYPAAASDPVPIEGLDHASLRSIVFHSGTSTQDGRVVASGGRVLSVTGWGDSPQAGVAAAYGALAKISFDAMLYRKDIGKDVN